MPREPQTNPLRKRKRHKVSTAADSTPIQARIPNAMSLEIERAARHELLASPTLCGARFWKNSNGSETKMEHNNKSLVRLHRSNVNSIYRSGSDAGQRGCRCLTKECSARPRPGLATHLTGGDIAADFAFGQYLQQKPKAPAGPPVARASSVRPAARRRPLSARPRP